MAVALLRHNDNNNGITCDAIMKRNGIGVTNVGLVKKYVESRRNTGYGKRNWTYQFITIKIYDYIKYNLMQNLGMVLKKMILYHTWVWKPLEFARVELPSIPNGGPWVPSSRNYQPMPERRWRCYGRTWLWRHIYDALTRCAMLNSALSRANLPRISIAATIKSVV